VALIVCVHGVGQQLLGEENVGDPWRRSLHDGLLNAARDPMIGIR
jgi:hypothetical protein